jgi:hypothetical protein
MLKQKMNLKNLQYKMISLKHFKIKLYLLVKNFLYKIKNLPKLQKIF